MGTSFWPPLPTEDQLSVAGLSEDGTMISGWVRRPSALWEPDPDVLWRPPDALKSSDLDRMAEVVEVIPIGEDAWVQSQIRIADRYREQLLSMVKAGKMRLTARLRAWLGLADEADDSTLGLLSRGAQLAMKSTRAFEDPPLPDAPIWTPPRRHWVG